MNTTAIICEYNPLTNGHVKHLDIARKETKADAILCVMSGSFTQRGEAAILDKYVRAELAIMNGADIVVELPTLYAISPADNFAYGAMKIIKAYPDVKYLSFGSECGDIKLLKEAADLLYEEPDEFKIILKKYLEKGTLFPKARAQALEDYVVLKGLNKEIGEIINSPNNTLAIAYINAAKQLNVNIKFHTIKRETNYNSETLDELLPSAKAVREALNSNKREEIKNHVPENVYNTLVEFKTREFSLGDMILFKIRSLDGYKFEHYYDVTGGIHNRIKIAAETSNSYEEMINKAKSKNVTLARIKRICLYALFDIEQKLYDDALNYPAYIQILAINANLKDKILSDIAKNTKNTLTRYSDVNRVDRQLRALIKLDFTAQGTLSIANKATNVSRKMVVVSPNI